MKPATMAEYFMSRSDCDALSLASISDIDGFISLRKNSLKFCCSSTWDCSMMSASASACSCGNPTAYNFFDIAEFFGY